ncbi:MAG: hypothetical protein ABIM89_08945 [Mycobacteriales bacterium]
MRRKRAPLLTAQQLLDEAYDARLRALERIRSSAGVVHASRARLESAQRSSSAELERLEERARELLAAGDETGARAVAAKCVPIDGDIEAAAHELGKYRDAEAHLETMRDMVAQQLTTLRKQRESMRSAHASGAALETVRTQLDLLAAQFAPVERELATPPR